ncbi:hydroxyisourate hydrolase [Vallicoccus soli]|uniref:hydroxyisourate hydrolase n=1 Tax=Vallicoccus soli TaxID=2339232 RepID=UPI001C49A435|nr:hydroxyisourate hydrolase [Vallicoccus soli]
MPVSVEVVDVVHGAAASGVEVRLEARDGSGWREVATVAADDDGAVPASAWGAAAGPLGPAAALRVVVASGRFFASLGLASAQTEVAAALRAADAGEQRVSVLLAPSACTVHTAPAGAPTSTSAGSTAGTPTTTAP